MEPWAREEYIHVFKLCLIGCGTGLACMAVFVFLVLGIASLFCH